MGNFPQSFEVYGFTIEVHAGGRRVWPPSFKRFVKQKLDSCELTVGEIMEACNVSQSLVYKWRSDVRRANGNRTAAPEERVFSEIVFANAQPSEPGTADNVPIVLRSQQIEISLPSAYPVDDLVKVILALEGRA